MTNSTEALTPDLFQSPRDRDMVHAAGFHNSPEKRLDPDYAASQRRAVETSFILPWASYVASGKAPAGVEVGMFGSLSYGPDALVAGDVDLIVSVDASAVSSVEAAARLVTQLGNDIPYLAAPGNEGELIASFLATAQEQDSFTYLDIPSAKTARPMKYTVRWLRAQDFLRSVDGRSSLDVACSRIYPNRLLDPHATRQTEVMLIDGTPIFPYYSLEPGKDGFTIRYPGNRFSTPDGRNMVSIPRMIHSALSIRPFSEKAGSVLDTVRETAWRTMAGLMKDELKTETDAALKAQVRKSVINGAYFSDAFLDEQIGKTGGMTGRE